jgi:hypothetical protein
MGKRAGNPKIAIASIRVSTEDQRLGPEARRAAIEAWAAREGVHVAAWHVDQGVSGAAPIEERPGLLGAISALRACESATCSPRSVVVTTSPHATADPIANVSISRSTISVSVIRRTKRGKRCLFDRVCYVLARFLLAAAAAAAAVARNQACAGIGCTYRTRRRARV